MVMIKIKFNKIRLNEVINDFIENLEDLEYSIKKYSNIDKEDEMELRLVSKSIIVSSCSIYKISEYYLGMTLKKVGIGVSDMTFKSCTNLAFSRGLLPQEVKEFLIKNVNVRNIDAHTYNQPSIEELIFMFNENRELLYRYLEFLKDLYKNGFDKKDLFKDSDIFN